MSSLCSPRRVYCGNGEHVETPIGIKCGDRTGFTRPRASGQRSRGSATWSTVPLTVSNWRFTSIWLPRSSICERIPGDRVTFVLAMLFGDDLLSTCETVNIVSCVSFHTISLSVPHVPRVSDLWIFKCLLCDVFNCFLLHGLKSQFSSTGLELAGCLFDWRLASCRVMFLFALVNPLDFCRSNLPLYIWTDVWPLSPVNELLIPVVTTVSCCPPLDRGGSAPNTSTGSNKPSPEEYHSNRYYNHTVFMYHGIYMDLQRN